MGVLKAVFDTNVYLMYLLSPNPAGATVDRLLVAAASGDFELLLPVDVIVEFNTVVRENPRIAARVTQQQAERLLRTVSASARVLPLLDVAPPAVCRDPKDDFLIAVAVLHGADYLVTRDHDLLTLGPVPGLKIVDPADLLTRVHAGDGA